MFDNPILDIALRLGAQKAGMLPQQRQMPAMAAPPMPIPQVAPPAGFNNNPIAGGEANPDMWRTMAAMGGSPFQPGSAPPQMVGTAAGGNPILALMQQFAQGSAPPPMHMTATTAPAATATPAPVAPLAPPAPQMRGGADPMDPRQGQRPVHQQRGWGWRAEGDKPHRWGGW